MATFVRDEMEPIAHIVREVQALFESTGAKPYEDAMNIVDVTLFEAMCKVRSPSERMVLRRVQELVNELRPYFQE